MLVLAVRPERVRPVKRQWCRRKVVPIGVEVQQMNHVTFANVIIHLPHLETGKNLKEAASVGTVFQDYVPAVQHVRTHTIVQRVGISNVISAATDIFRVNVIY